MQQLLSKVEEDKRRQREKELVKKMRPKLSDDQRTADGAHPIETVDQLADWHVQRIEQAQREDAVDRPPQPQPSGKAEEADREEKKDEADERDEEEEDSAQERLASQLESMLGKLRERISDVDAQIGERLHLLHPSDPSGLVDDSDLADAIMRLQKVDASRVQRLLRRIEELARQRRAGQGKREGRRGRPRRGPSDRRRGDGAERARPQGAGRGYQRGVGCARTRPAQQQAGRAAMAPLAAMSISITYTSNFTEAPDALLSESSAGVSQSQLHCTARRPWRRLSSRHPVSHTVGRPHVQEARRQ